MHYINNPMQLISPTTIKTYKNMETLNGSRKFSRRRDSSTDSFKRANLATPKSSNGSFKLNDVVRKRCDNVEDDIGLVKLIKANSYMKIVQAPFSTKLSQNQKNYDEDQDEKSTNQQSRLTFQKPAVKQNLSKLYRTPKNNKEKTDEDCFENYRILTSTRNTRKSEKQLTKYEDQCSSTNFGQTSRQASQKFEDSYFTQTKILQNQILILEDENSRLKKQIAQLTQEKQQQKRKRYEFERQVILNDDKFKNLAQKHNDLLLNTQKNIEALYMQVTRIFGFTCQEINEVLTQQQNQLKHQQTLCSSGLKQSTEINSDNFVQDFLSPTCSNIVECILAYRKRFEESKLNLSKLEIKQNIMLRNQSETRKLKDQLKYLTDKYHVERNRVQRYKVMYEKLKKQFDRKKYSFQIKNNEKNGSELRRSFNVKNSSKLDEEDIQFILSDASDDEGNARKRPSLRAKC